MFIKSRTIYIVKIKIYCKRCTINQFLKLKTLITDQINHSSPR